MWGWKQGHVLFDLNYLTQLKKYQASLGAKYIFSFVRTNMNLLEQMMRYRCYLLVSQMKVQFLKWWKPSWNWMWGGRICKHGRESDYVFLCMLCVCVWVRACVCVCVCFNAYEYKMSLECPWVEGRPIFSSLICRKHYSFFLKPSPNHFSSSHFQKHYFTGILIKLQTDQFSFT